VITGLGTVLASGAGREVLAAALATGTPRLSPIEDHPGFRARELPRQAALARHLDLSPWVSPARARRMSLPSRFACAAAAMALADAGLAAGATGRGQSAVVLATAFGTANFAEQLIREILLEGPENASPFLFSESVANAPAAQVAIAAEARGANVAVTQREAGPLQAVILAARELRLGRSRIALAGCYEEVNPLVHAVLARFRALAPTGGGGAARPFDRERAGFLAAEGSTVLVLERAGDAAARGARALAELVAWEQAFDPTASAHGWGSGAEALAARLLAALARRGIAPQSIDRVVSGASGSVAGDALEAGVLRRLFGDGVPPVLAPKGVTGEHAGGQLAAAVLAAAGAAAWPTAGFATPDPDLGLTPHDGSPLPPARRVLVTALAAGGAAAWLVLDAPQGNAP
jgi:3-oxoacyl-[acyl-carrier-protein] synthase II